MAYYLEDTVRQPMLRDINNMAMALGVTVFFDDVDSISVSALQTIHTDLLSRCQAKQFDLESDKMLDDLEATINTQDK